MASLLESVHFATRRYRPYSTSVEPVFPSLRLGLPRNFYQGEYILDHSPLEQQKPTSLNQQTYRDRILTVGIQSRSSDQQVISHYEGTIRAATSVV